MILAGRLLQGSLRPTYSGVTDAGWSSSVARWAHNPEVAGSNPAPATTFSQVRAMINDHGFDLAPHWRPNLAVVFGAPLGRGTGAIVVAPGTERSRAAGSGSSSSWCWVLTPEVHVPGAVVGPGS